MHCLIALLYGVVVWLAAVLFVLIAHPSATMMMVVGMPVIVSGAMVGLLALDGLLVLLWRLIALPTMQFLKRLV